MGVRPGPDSPMSPGCFGVELTATDEVGQSNVRYGAAMEPPIELPINEHVVVGVFQDAKAARRAVEALRDAGIDESAVSFVCRDEGIPRESVEGQFTEEVVDEVEDGLVEGALVGTAAGGLAGLLAGALGSVIPGVGPVVGTGIWAAIAGAMGADATMGLMLGGMRKMWELTYRDAVTEGRALVSVHSDDVEVVERAEAVIRRLGPLRLDHFDEGGEILHEHVEPANDRVRAAPKWPSRSLDSGAARHGNRCRSR